MSISYQQGGFDFQNKSQSIASNILKISQNASSIERLLSSAHPDSQAMAQIHNITTYTHTLSKDTAEDLKTLASLTTGKHEKLQRDKLTSDFASALNSFQSAQKSAASKEKQQLREFKHDAGMDSQLQPPPQAYQMKQVQMQDDFQEQQLEEMRHREEAIRQLESDILDVNQIFRELATLVHEQGETIDSIEAHIETSSIRVSEGTQQLQKANSYSTAARKKKLCLFGTGAAILIILILIIYYSS